MTKNQKYLALATLAIAVVALVTVGVRANLPNSDSTKLKVAASFYPLAEFARAVGGDKVEVTTMVKPGVEPHDYDPAPGDLTSLYKSKVFVYNGAQLEKWVPRIQKDLDSHHVLAVNASTGITLKPATGEENAGSPDPHIWLDPILASHEVDNIAAGLGRADPANAAYYQDRAAKYKADLAQLDQDFAAGLSQCTRHDIVTSHQAFGYLGSHYGLSVLPISGLSPDAEPTPQQLADVAKFALAHHVKYIFFETLVSPKLSETIAKEVGAKALVFNPLEGLTDEEIKQGGDYLSVQKDNLNNLRIALDCK